MKKLLILSALLLGFASQAQAQKMYTVFNEGTKTLTFYYDGKSSSHTEGTVFDITCNKSFDYDNFYDMPLMPWADIETEVEQVSIDPSFAKARPTSTARWFEGLTDIKEIKGIEYLNTSEVEDMKHMFSECYSLETLDVAHFQTGKVRSMGGMFASCTRLKAVDVSGFDTRNVENMAGMFDECYELKTLDVSGFDTGNVIAMQCMFRSCGKLEYLDVSHFDTGNVVQMWMMFGGCGSLKNLDLSSFDTRKVETFDQLFDGCSGLTELHLESFTVRNFDPGNMKGMFTYCNGLQRIYVSPDNPWTFEPGKEMDNNMFSNCPRLRGNSETRFSEDHTGADYAHIGTSDNPGYFSVYHAPEGVELDPAEIVFNNDNLDGVFLYYSVLPSNASNTEVKWSTNGYKVVVLEDYSARGYCIVKPRGPGQCTVTATACNGVSASVQVTVPMGILPFKKVRFDVNEVTLYAKGEKIQLNVVYEPEGSTYNGKLRFVSTNTKVAKINDKGLVTAVGYGHCKLQVWWELPDGTEDCTQIYIDVVSPDGDRIRD